MQAPRHPASPRPLRAPGVTSMEQHRTAKTRQQRVGMLPPTPNLQSAPNFTPVCPRRSPGPQVPSPLLRPPLLLVVLMTMERATSLIQAPPEVKTVPELLRPPQGSLLCRLHLARPLIIAWKLPRPIGPEQTCARFSSNHRVLALTISRTKFLNFSAKRPVSATLSASGRGIGYKSAKEARKSCTVPEPFSFDNRERFKKKPIVQLRLEQEMLERLEIEQIEYSQVTISSIHPFSL